MRSIQSIGVFLAVVLGIAGCASEPAPIEPPSEPAAATFGDGRSALEPGESWPSVLRPAEIVMLGPVPACADCRIVLAEPFELTGDFPDGGTPGGLAALVRATDGRFAAVYWDRAAAQIVVYDQQGRRQSVLGAEGSGPGEFQSIGNQLFVDGTTLHAVDTVARRRTALRVASGEVLGTGPAPRFTWEAVFFDDGTMVVSGAPPIGEAAGFPLHVYDAQGERVRSFGLNEPLGGLDSGVLLHYALARAPDGTFWSAAQQELLVEQWTLDGTRIVAFSGLREGFEPALHPTYFAQGEKPSPRVSDISVDELGNVWLLYSIPRADWEDALLPVPADERRGPESPDFRLKPGGRLSDHYLEVIDPEHSILLARVLLPESYHGFADPHTLMRGWTDESGLSRVAVVDVLLERVDW